MYQSDIDLIETYSNGDMEAIETLIGRYFARVYSFLYRLSKSESDASDITQDVFVKVWQKIRRFDRTREFSPWLFAIAHNTFLDWTRKKKPLLFSNLASNDEMPFEESLADAAPLADEVFENKEWKAILETALAALPLAQKEIIILHHNEDMTFDAIAAMLKKPINTVKSSYRRGIAKLRASLEDLQHAPK